MTRRWKGLSFTRERVLGVAGIAALLLLGVVLPYLSLEYYNDASELVRPTERLLGAGDLVGGVDPTYLPGYRPAVRRDLTLGLNVVSVGIGLQEIGSLVAAAAVVGQLFDEINKFLWWPLHLASYLLVLVPLPLLVGAALLHQQGVPVRLGPGWVPALLAGVVAMVLTFRSHRRIDTYGGF